MLNDSTDNFDKYSTLESIRAADNADLFAWCEWNDSDGDWEGMEDETEILRAHVAYAMDLYPTIEAALEGEGYFS